MDITEFLIPFLTVNLVAAGIVLKFLSSRKNAPRPVIDTSAAFSDFDRRLSTVGNKIQTLEEHANEYPTVFSENGYAELSRLHVHLCNVHNLLLDLKQTRDKQAHYEAGEILEWLSSKKFGGPTPVLVEQLVGSDTHLLKLWEPHLNDLIVKITIALSEAAEQTQQLGIKRGRKRNATLMSIKELVGADTLAKYFQRSDW